MNRTIAEVLTNGKEQYLDYDFGARDRRRNGRPLNVAVAQENLLLLKSVFEKHEIPFWLLFGTLLGAVRDRSFIPYDTDTDVGAFAADKDKIIACLPDLQAVGLIPFRTKHPDDLLSLMRGDEYIDIGLFSKHKDLEGYEYWNYQNNRVYGEHFDKFDTVSFLDTTFLIPQQAEKLLEAHYGATWKTPVKHQPAKEPSGHRDFESYSNLIDLAHVFEGRDDYVILKLPEHFPNYFDYSDVDILCADKNAMKAHILEVAKQYEPKGFTVSIAEADNHEHIDLFAPGSPQLNLRFDLLESLVGYRNIIVDPTYHERVLATKREIVTHGVKILVPAPEHDLAIRFMEYIEWGQDRPSKKKHLDYVQSQKSLLFMEVLKRHTNLDVSLDTRMQTINVVVRNDVTPASFCSVQPRMDYFMIWGHGLHCAGEILERLRSDPNFEIVSIVKRQIDNMEQFVSDIYACDSVPMHHLVAKTRYLLSTKPEILFILVKNNNPREEYFGEGVFRHIQCRVVKELKEELRIRFNPRVNGKRTEHHVLHASDYESQVEHVLKVLGLHPVAYYSRVPNPTLDVPYHIGAFDRYEVKEVDVDSLYANIIGHGLVPLEKTPHFMYTLGHKDDYREYHESHMGKELTDDHFPESFDRMIDELDYGRETPSGKKCLILARRLDDGTYQILDGVHRAAILKSRKVRTVKIAVPRYQSVGRSEARVVAVVFSKDRALQLDAALRSFLLQCKDPDLVDVKVLYATSSLHHRQQYELLRGEFPSVEFIAESNFKSDLTGYSGLSEYVLFLVDDNIVVREFSIADVIDALSSNPAVLGVSLRLGANTAFCYMLNKQQALPEFQPAGPALLSYEWTSAEHDFGYPLELSSSLYRTSDILPLLNGLSYRNPNTLELVLAQQCDQFRQKKNRLLCYPQSRTFCNPINTVQREFDNRSGKQKSLSPEALAEDFDRGYRIDVKQFSGFKPVSCHQECSVQYLPIDKRSRGQGKLNNPLASIVLLNYNGLTSIAQCLSSIARNTPERHEIIVVDNASTDGSLGFLRKLDNITLVENETNRGCPGARSQGISIARGDYVILLDNDTVVTHGWLTTLIEHAELDEKIGIIGPRSNYVSGAQIVTDAHYESIPELESFARRHASQHRGELSPSSRLVGFCMLIRRVVIDRIGNIDGSFGKFGFEDDDFVWRAQIAGFKTVIANDVFVHHTGGPQGRGDSSYNKQLLDAWEVFKKKWNIPASVRYGTPLDLREILSVPFDPSKHFVPLMTESELSVFLRRGEGVPKGMHEAYSAGLKCAQSGQQDRAIELLQHVRASLISDPDAQGTISIYDVEMCLADCHLIRERLQEAREHYERALRRNPESAEACYGLGLCFQYSGFEDSAREMFECAVALRPEWEQAKQKVLEVTVVA